ncbi:MAG: metallophosphoesterase [Phycisphaerales bacterium]|nr:metallophosphoesterase [Phycisphaerales bacterium]
MPDSQRRTRPLPRAAAIAALVFLALTPIAFGLHAALWTHGPYVLRLEPLGWLLKPLGNLMHILTAPGWLIARLMLRSWGEADLVASAIACDAGIAILCVLGLWLRALRRELLWKPAFASDSPTLRSRRRFLTNTLSVGCPALVGGTLVDAACRQPLSLDLARYTIPIRDLPPSLNGLRLVQISDTHLGLRVPRDFIQRALDRAIALKPDVFVLTGDYVHCGLEWLEPAAQQLACLVRWGIPTVAVRGNHDWFNDGRGMGSLMQSVGIRVIDNDRLFVTRSPAAITLLDTPSHDALCIAGLGDLRQHVVDPDTALHGVPPSMPRIVLAHNPDTAEHPSVTRRGSPRIDLMLSGHTHGGQVRIPGLGTGAGLVSSYGEKYAVGLVQGPACPVLITRGVGMSLVPIRFLVPPEIVEVTLIRDAPQPVAAKEPRTS